MEQGRRGVRSQSSGSSHSQRAFRKVLAGSLYNALQDVASSVDATMDSLVPTETGSALAVRGDMPEALQLVPAESSTVIPSHTAASTSTATMGLGALAGSRGIARAAVIVPVSDFVSSRGVMDAAPKSRF